MSKLTQKMQVGDKNVTFYTTISEANGCGNYGTAIVGGVSAYYALGTGSSAETGSNFKTSLKVIKNGTTYYVLTQARNLISLYYYAQNKITNYQTITSLPTENFEELNYSIATDTGAGAMFAFQNCEKLTSLDVLSTIDTNALTTTTYMFKNCEALTSAPLFDTSNVVNMSYMFRNCSNLISIPQYNTSSVTNADWAFGGCTSLNTIQQLNTRSMKTMYCMFNGCASLPATFPWIIDCTSITGTHSLENIFSDSSVTSVKLSNVPSSLRPDINSTLLKNNNTLSIQFV